MKQITAVRLAAFTEQDYIKAFGVTKEDFGRMLSTLETAYCREHKRRPRFTKLTMQDKLIFTLIYRNEYRSMESIAEEYGVSRDTVSDNIHWVERSLLNAELLSKSVTSVYKTS